jgi:outer membrane immunogenic protein
VRGRVGYLISPDLLAYGTGGLVYGHTRNDFTQVISSLFPPPLFTSTTVIDGTRNVSTGWTVGGGFEWALDRKWSVKLEYDYLSFDDAVASTTKIRVLVGKGQLPLNASFDVQSPNNSAHTIQIGLNYHFWN